MDISLRDVLFCSIYSVKPVRVHQNQFLPERYVNLTTNNVREFEIKEKRKILKRFFGQIIHSLLKPLRCAVFFYNTEKIKCLDILVS